MEPRVSIHVKTSLAEEADPAIIRFARFLARQAAREDHEREMKVNSDENSGHLRAVFDESPK